MNIAVVGLGHIGLPLAAQYASKGHRVRGCDINQRVVDMVNAGQAYDDEPGLEARVAEAVAAGLLTAQTNTADAVRASDVVVVIVPLMVDAEKAIAYNAIDSATRDVASGLTAGTLVIYETTLPVGDTRKRFGPMLAAGSGLTVNEQFSLAFSPERVYVGRVFEDLKKYPKIVGGTDADSTRKAGEFYRAVLDAEITEVDNAETAEFTKLAETTYRDVNIALANEFAAFAEEHGIDVLQSIDAANSQPFSHIHRPGAGVGGHCIPVYPYFYANNTRFADVARLSREVNDGMAAHVVGRLDSALVGLSGRKIGVFGWAYRENVKEDAFTVARRLVDELTAADAEVVVDDPLYTADELAAKGLTPYQSGEALDAIVIQAMHEQYADCDWARIPGLQVILDGRNALRTDQIPDSVRVIGVGRLYIDA
ncbi:MAG: nucleotide sugar dehydrogenase [Thermomicrobiales bacterium]|nr:nucleotide sugar dehydrogenase [Thermomicrobiales bacterium]